VDNTTPTITQFKPLDTPEWVLTALGEERAAHWMTEREPYRPEVTVVDGPTGTAAVLTSGRPNTQYTKIVDLWGSTDDAAEELLNHVVQASAHRGDAGVKWEVRAGEQLPALETARGFTPLCSPIPSADGTTGVDGFVHWHGPWPHPQLTYYGQTTEFTCGAVAAMTAMTGLGMDPFGADGGHAARERELHFWRLATNFPACEPIGLAVTLHDAVAQNGNLRIEVYLDTDEPTLLEGFEGGDRQFREILQAESTLAAAERKLPIRRVHLDVDAVMARVSAGDLALLLIDEAIMHDSSIPHWVLAHSVRDRTVLLHDPWITAARGETWVDSHDLPVSAEALDTLLAFGEPAYRGVIFITP
jgi:hypothetical protein